MARADDLKAAIIREQANPTPNSTTLANIRAFQAELDNITNAEAQAQDMSAFDQNKFDVDAYLRELGESSKGQRSAIDSIFGAQQTAGQNAINDLFGEQRGQAIEEAAALGNLRQPTFASSTLANIDANKMKQSASFLNDLFGRKGQALATLEQGLGEQASQGRQFGANYGLNRATNLSNLLQGNRQFGQNLNLSQSKLGMQQRQQDMDEIFRNAELAETVRGRVDKPQDILGDIQKGVGIAKDVVGLGTGLLGTKSTGKRQGGLFPLG